VLEVLLLRSELDNGAVHLPLAVLEAVAIVPHGKLMQRLLILEHHVCPSKGMLSKASCRERGGKGERGRKGRGKGEGERGKGDTQTYKQTNKQTRR
tara:strand:- start:192 stop:479 length:288 start_codon:yes stop_codon:yes gene_type:complete